MQFGEAAILRTRMCTHNRAVMIHLILEKLARQKQVRYASYLKHVTQLIPQTANSC